MQAAGGQRTRSATTTSFLSLTVVIIQPIAYFRFNNVITFSGTLATVLKTR